MIYLDTETCGLHGVPVILQYARDDGEVKIHEFWRNPIQESLELIEDICSDTVCGFNLSFDWFQIYKIWTMFSMACQTLGRDAYPEDHIDELGIIEEKARFYPYCLKPKSAMDIMLHARKGPYQSLMGRDDIRIRRVPTPLAWKLADELEKRVHFDSIYFAKSKDPLAPKWKVFDIKKPDGSINPDFKDIKLKFRASGALKNLYRHAFKVTEKVFTFRDVELDRKWWPNEIGYAPFAMALGKPEDWKWTWPEVIREHILHWGFNSDARKYASDDVVYTRRLYVEHFNSPPPDDDDSILACMVACNRWRGYAVNLEGLKQLRVKAINRIKSTPIAPHKVREYILDAMDPIERVAFPGSTKKTVLEEIVKEWKDDDGKLLPAAVRAKEVLEARQAKKEIEIYDKLLLAQRFHASFVVIGTLSSRMAGSDKFNPQGVKHTKDVRSQFPLADNTDAAVSVIARHLGIPVSEVKRTFLCGGDFKSFEVSLSAAVFKDPALDAALKTGKKVHAMLGMELFPGNSYEDILKSEATDNDMYDKGKKGYFLLIYGGDANTFKNKLGIALEIGQPAFDRFLKKHPKIAEARKKVQDEFGALTQPGGIGTKVEWHEPADYVESFLGFRRYFTLENRVCKTLFELAQNPPKEWSSVKVKVMRRDRIQTASGALQSALYAAAFGISSAIVRAAMNHKIQSPGGQITKATQRNIWDLQPAGVHEWIVQPMNIHDELMCPTAEGYEDQVEAKAKETVQRYRAQVPLLAIDWIRHIPNWAGKKG